MLLVLEFAVCSGRREAEICRLEWHDNDGYQIHEVAQFTLHESWNELKRYTNLRPRRSRHG